MLLAANMEDEAVYKRMIKSGRVVYGRASYGIPTIREFAYDDSKLLVGSYCSIGGTYLLGGQHAITHVTTYPLRINYGLDGAGQDGMPVIRGDIVVGSDVWTGYGSWIMSGLTIGHGAVVATGSVVTKDIPPYAIVGGIPAQVIRYRHTPEQRRRPCSRFKKWVRLARGRGLRGHSPTSRTTTSMPSSHTPAKKDAIKSAEFSARNSRSYLARISHRTFNRISACARSSLVLWV